MSRAAVVELIRKGQRFLLSCHTRPDGDAIGSMLGVDALLRSLGKETWMFNVDPVPPSLHFLPGIERIERAVPDGTKFDAFLITDTASRTLLPANLPPTSVTGPVVILDHHFAHDDFGDVIAREPDAVATAEVVMRLMKDLGVERIPAEAAMPLYTALVADTGGFRYRGTSGDILRMAASLLDAGADAVAAPKNLFEVWSADRMRLLQLSLETLETHFEGRFALVQVTQQMSVETRTNEDDAEGLVNYPRMLAGVEVAALLFQRAGDAPVTKVSLRANHDVDVSTIAITMGGGGHRAAAGAAPPIAISAARETLLAAVARALGVTS
ncbi:MAG: DHH family phosphoesterase [Sandaracinaceae bacterium]|jgi:phosphoesterase RecJ-like protein|nr:DHH family phosphoesterase [Sandaracinaceae bacterium]